MFFFRKILMKSVEQQYTIQQDLGLKTVRKKSERYLFEVSIDLLNLLRLRILPPKETYSFDPELFFFPRTIRMLENDILKERYLSEKIYPDYISNYVFWVPR